MSQSYLGEPKKYVVLVLGKEGVDRDQRQTKAVQNMGPEVSRDGGMTGKTVKSRRWIWTGNFLWKVYGHKSDGYV